MVKRIVGVVAVGIGIVLMQFVDSDSARTIGFLVWCAGILIVAGSTPLLSSTLVEVLAWALGIITILIRGVEDLSRETNMVVVGVATVAMGIVTILFPAEWGERRSSKVNQL